MSKLKKFSNMEAETNESEDKFIDQEVDKLIKKHIDNANVEELFSDSDKDVDMEEHLSSEEMENIRRENISENVLEHKFDEKTLIDSFKSNMVDTLKSCLSHIEIENEDIEKCIEAIYEQDIQPVSNIDFEALSNDIERRSKETKEELEDIHKKVHNIETVEESNEEIIEDVDSKDINEKLNPNNLELRLIKYQYEKHNTQDPKILESIINETYGEDNLNKPSVKNFMKIYPYIKMFNF